jgi:hypothetical protein
VKLIRFHDTPDGGSRFEEIEVAFSQSREDAFGHTLHQTLAIEPEDAVLVELPDGLDQGWHNAPARQIVVVLRGVVEVETTDHQKRRWTAGDAFFADDLRGKGHLTRVSGGPAQLLFLRLPTDFDPASWCR